MSTAPTPIHRRRTPQVPLTAVVALLLAAILVTLLVGRAIFRSSTSPAGTGSGVAGTQARSLAPFSGIELAGDNNVVVRVGPRQSVVVHADTNLLSRVTTGIRAGTLVIGETPGTLDARTPMFVAVSVPSLDAIVLDGSGNVAVSGISSRSLTIALPGSGNIQATGRTARLAVTVSGSGNAFLGRLISRDATASLSGDGTIALTATGSVDASVSGSGTIAYGGNPPQVRTSVTGSGTITPG